MEKLKIIGGGVAGLALSCGLGQRQLPVRVCDAGKYPRHRVCGEFICGVGFETLDKLGLSRLSELGVIHRNVAWFRHGKQLLKSDLPVEVIGLSRYTMDAYMASLARSRGVEVLESAQADVAEPAVGQVDARGRAYRKGPWLGLKMHLTAFDPEADLEVHLGQHSYVGVSAVEDGRYNLCGLFRRIPGLRGRGPELLINYLRGAGLEHLLERIDREAIDESSVMGVSHFDFKRPEHSAAHFQLGDRWGVIPPFTGNGMSIALETAAAAVEPLVEYSQGSVSWEEATRLFSQSVVRKLDFRLRTANALHPFLLNPAGQTSLGWLSQSGLLPFQALFRATH